MTLYSLQNIPDAPLTATANTSGDKSPADHEGDQAVLHSTCRIVCSFISGTCQSLVRINHLETSPSTQFTVSKPASRPLQTCFAQVMIYQNLQSRGALTVCGSDGHQQRLSPYTVKLAVAPVTRRELGRL